MARETLQTALKLMFGHEGGYSDRKSDSGGPTKYGVTYRTLAAHRGISLEAAREAIKSLTLFEAADVYRKGYWTQSGGDLLPVGLDYMAFDFGVNSGPARAVKVLQQVLGVSPDGNAGPQTLAAVKAYSGGLEKLLHDYADARMAFLRSLTNKKTGFPVNGRGWTIRVTGIDPKGQYKSQPGVIGNALELAASGKAADAEVLPAPAPAAGGDAKAEPDKPNAWTKPETVLQGIGALSGLSAMFAGSGPVQWALGGVLVISACVAAYLIIRRIRSNPA